MNKASRECHACSQHEHVTLSDLLLLGLDHRRIHAWAPPSVVAQEESTYLGSDRNHVCIPVPE